jgi:hypothetical protein
MSVGRKAGGPRDEEDFEDDIVSSDGSSISAVPPMLPPGHLSPPVAYRQSPRAALATTITSAKPVLPSFETFCRDANAIHHRSISLPVPAFDIATSSTQSPYATSRKRRTYSEAPVSSPTSRSAFSSSVASSYTAVAAAPPLSYTNSHIRQHDRF